MPRHADRAAGHIHLAADHPKGYDRYSPCCRRCRPFAQQALRLNLMGTAFLYIKTGSSPRTTYASSYKNSSK